jgi:hypothetical protein
MGYDAQGMSDTESIKDPYLDTRRAEIDPGIQWLSHGNRISPYRGSTIAIPARPTSLLTADMVSPDSTRSTPWPARPPARPIAWLQRLRTVVVAKWASHAIPQAGSVDKWPIFGDK